MTKEERQKIYAALAAPFPESCIQRTDGRVTGRGYSTTGIGYQFIANRLNEVLGVGGWRTDRTIHVREVTSPKGRPMFEATCDVKLQLGEWQAGRFEPFADAVADGGHVSVVEADARKGAFTNGLKKAAAFLGVGRQAYEGTLDDDNVPSDEPIDLVPTARAREVLERRQPPPPAQTPSPPSLPSRSRLTSKQLAAIRAICRRLEWNDADLRTLTVERYGCQPDFMTREQASHLIEELGSPSVNGRDREHQFAGAGPWPGGMSMHALRVLRDTLHVSVSQIRCFTRCPQQYELKYVIGSAPAFVPVALAFGSAIHRALAFVYTQQSADEPPALDQVLQVFRESWTEAERGPVPLQREDEGHDWVAKGTQMLTDFYRGVELSPASTVQAVELPFDVAVHDPDTGEVLEERFIGAFDLVLREQNRCTIVEHKTSSRRYTGDQLRYDQQLSAYKLAARQMEGIGDARLRFQVLCKTKVPFTQIEEVERDEQDEVDFLRTVVGVLRAVNAGAFYPIRGWQCQSCAFSHDCPGHR